MAFLCVRRLFYRIPPHKHEITKFQMGKDPEGLLRLKAKKEVNLGKTIQN